MWYTLFRNKVLNLLPVQSITYIVADIGEPKLANMLVAVVPDKAKVRVNVSMPSIRTSVLIGYVTVTVVSPAAKSTVSIVMVDGDV